MADLTAGGVPVRRDSAGVLRDVSDVAVTDGTPALPTSDFTPEQMAMAKLPLPFRNLIRDPFVATVGTVTAYGAYADQIAAKACSSFRIINPNTCYIRFRGATGTSDTMTEGQGRLMAPGAVETFSTQNPTHLAVIAVARPGFPVPAELAAVELNYGIGG
ncbi:MAG: hypothetical protein ABW128_15520 [Rhizorhabdus sp.]